MQRPNKINLIKNEKGFGLLTIISIIAIITTLLSIYATPNLISGNLIKKLKIKDVLEQNKANFENILSSNAGWNYTLTLNTALSCLNNISTATPSGYTACSNGTLVPYDIDGTLLPTSFNSDGSICSNASCDINYTFNWTLISKSGQNAIIKIVSNVSLNNTIYSKMVINLTPYNAILYKKW